MTIDGRSGGGAAGDMDHDARLDRLYREAAREEPPAHLDAAIRAAARREVGARPRSLALGLRGWRIPVSIAAVVVLSVSLVTLIREEGGEPFSPAPRDTPLTLQLPPSETAKGATPSPDIAAARERPASRDDTHRRSASTGVRGTENRTQLDEAASVARDSGRQTAPELDKKTNPQPFQSAPGEEGGVPAAPSTAVPRPAAPAGSAERSAPPAVASPAPGATRAPIESVERQGAPVEAAKLMAKPAPRLEQDAAPPVGVAGAASSMKPQATPAPAERPRPKAEARLQKSERLFDYSIPTTALLKDLESQPPEKWLERIEELRREGRTGAADDVLAEFRRRFPQHPVPPRLQAK